MPETTELGSSAAYPPPPLIQRFETLNMKDTHSFIRSYPVSSRKLSQSPLLGPNHLCWCPSLSLQSRGHGRNSDTTDSTHPVCRKKPSKQESNRVKSSCMPQIKTRAHTHTDKLSLSLSLSLHIYIYIYISVRWKRHPGRPSVSVCVCLCVSTLGILHKHIHIYIYMYVTLHITEHMLHIHILATTQRVKFLDKGVNNSVVESSGGPLTSVRRCSSAPGSC